MSLQGAAGAGQGQSQGLSQVQGQAQHQAQFAVEDDTIRIGSRHFTVKLGVDTVRQPEMLARVRDLLATYYSPTQFEQAFIQLVHDPAQPLILVEITSQGAAVHKPSFVSAKDVKQKEPTVHIKKSQLSNEFSEKVGSLHNELVGYVEFNAKLRKELQSKGYSKEDVQAAISQIFEEGHISLLDIMEGRGPSEWEEKTIADLLVEPGNEGLHSALKSIEKDFIKLGVDRKGIRGIYKGAQERVASMKRSTQLFFQRTTKKQACYSDIKVFILKNLQRNPRVVMLDDGGAIGQQFIKGRSDLKDKIGKQVLSPADVGESGKGYPSEADKGEYRKDILHNNTNLGAVVVFDKQGNPEKVVAMRSGKSDTFERLVENSLVSYMQQLDCPEKNRCGVSKRADGSYEFQHTITSYLDPSALKAFGETYGSFNFTQDNERQFLTKILKDLDSWPPDGVTVQLQGKDGPITVHLMRPIVCNQLLSSTVRGVGTATIRFHSMGQAMSDRINFFSNTQLLAKYPGGLSPEVMKAKSAFDKSVGSLSYSELIKNNKIFESDEAKVYKQAIAKFLLDEVKSGKDPDFARAFFSLFFRRFADSDINLEQMHRAPAPDEEMHVADMEIMRNLVLEKLGLPVCKECKSGTDRTAIGIALACAQEKYTRAMGEPYIPASNQQTTELLRFKKFFREALKEMGVSIVCETKGYSGIKWGGGIPFLGGIANPSAYKYLYLQEDVAPLQKLGIDSVLRPDVAGLTYKDLGKCGNSQYKGRLLNPQALYGKSDPKFAKQLAETKGEFSVALRESIAKKAQDFLINELKLSAFKDQKIINASLELVVHVRDLDLDAPIDKDTKMTRAQMLHAKIAALENNERSEVEGLELYILKKIENSWRLRARAKEIKHFKPDSITAKIAHLPPIMLQQE